MSEEDSNATTDHDRVNKELGLHYKRMFQDTGEKTLRKCRTPGDTVPSDS